MAFGLAGGTPATAQEVIDDGDVVNVPGDRLSPWDITNNLFVGFKEQGTLNIGANGVVNVNNFTLIGANSGSEGTVTVTGAGAALNVTNGLTVGQSGEGMLDIGAGGTVTSGFSFIGSGGSGSGTVTVSGANALWSAGSMTIGRAGTGPGHGRQWRSGHEQWLAGHYRELRRIERSGGRCGCGLAV